MITIKCNLCGSENHRFLFFGRDRQLEIDKTLFRIVECGECGLVFINPQPGAEEVAKYYPPNYGPYQENDVFKYGFLSRSVRKFIELFKKIGNYNQKTEHSGGESINYLDFGCGGGEYLEVVRKLHPSWNLYGLDNNATACDNATKRGFRVFCGDAFAVNLPQNFFDVVNMSHVIEHLHNPKGTVREINQMLKSGGALIISTPNFDSLAARIFRSFWFTTDSPRHLFLFTTKTLFRMLREAGFGIKKIEYEKGPKVEIKSLYHFFGKRDLRINPFLWHLFKPITKRLASFGKSSIIRVVAEKNQG